MDKLNSQLMKYIENSPTSFHAVSNLETELLSSGYSELLEGDSWNIKSSGKYYVKRNDSGLIAFQMAKDNWEERGMRMVGGHTDSPALKVKPSPDMINGNLFQMAVEPYGGMILSTWFDRELSLAGRVFFKDCNNDLGSTLIDFKRPIAIVPSLAIHLNRGVNDGKAINKQKELPPILVQVDDNNKFNGCNEWLKNHIEDKVGKIDSVSDHELFFYDCNPPNFLGINNEFIVGPRLDNLLSCYIGLKGFLTAGNDITSVLVCNDHEECGSNSNVGATGTFVKSIIERIFGGNQESIQRSIDNSMLISADNAHAVHPNYMEKSEMGHAPQLNMGPVIKFNANQRYATSGVTSTLFQELCLKCDVNYQKFVARSDMGCGSTIGPYSSASLGVKTIDIGLPTLSMHSIRETAGSKDSVNLLKVLTQFFSHNFSLKIKKL